MLKLYKIIDNRFHYWETWDSNEETAIIHWGIAGQRGEDKEIKNRFFSNFRKRVQQEISRKLQEGYTEFDEDKMTVVEIEYNIDGFGTEQDLDKRHRLEELLDELLGWTGLGYVDGGSNGCDTMEVCCLVVDFDIAEKVIENGLQNTEFSDYSQIRRIDSE